MKPSIGRIVIYRLPEDKPDINGAREFPAVIVRVWSESCVNLRVFTDGPYTPWVTSVTLLPEDQGERSTCWWPFDRDPALSTSQTISSSGFVMF